MGDMTKDEWIEAFDDYIASRHTSTFGSSMATDVPETRREAAEAYAEMVMRVLDLRKQGTPQGDRKGK